MILLAHNEEAMLFTAADNEKAKVFLNMQALETFRCKISPSTSSVQHLIVVNSNRAPCSVND